MSLATYFTVTLIVIALIRDCFAENKVTAAKGAVGVEVAVISFIDQFIVISGFITISNS